MIPAQRVTWLGGDLFDLGNPEKYLPVSESPRRQLRVGINLDWLSWTG